MAPKHHKRLKPSKGKTRAAAKRAGQKNQRGAARFHNAEVRAAIDCQLQSVYSANEVVNAPCSPQLSPESTDKVTEMMRTL